MFTMAIKGDSNLTYAFFGTDMEVEANFKGFLSKVQDWKANFTVVKKSLPTNTTEVEAFTPYCFTTHWEKIPGNWERKYQLRG